MSDGLTREEAIEQLTAVYDGDRERAERQVRVREQEVAAREILSRRAAAVRGAKPGMVHDINVKTHNR